MSVRDPRAVELRAVAPLIVTATRQLVGPALLATNGIKTVAIASTEVLRVWKPTQLAIATTLDASSLVPVASWGLGRYSGIGVIELTAPVPAGADVAPLPISAVCASVETRGAPAALVTISGTTSPFVRDVVPVHFDKVDSSGGMSDDVITRLASPMEAAHAAAPVEGAVLFAWFPPDPVLGRPAEVLAVAMAYPYLGGVCKPRALAAFAELIGLDDLGRALIAAAPAAARPELGVVAGEFEDHLSDKPAPVLDGVDEYKRKRERP